MSVFVIDASVTMAWCFEDEKTPETERIVERLAAGARARVPALWPYEVLNALVVAQRRKRITQAHSSRFWRELQAFTIDVVRDEGRRSYPEVLALSEQYGLTAYDAAYLEMALREGLPLATLDADLKKAAKSVGVELVR